MRSCIALHSKLRCVSITALGDAVVPPVGASTATSSAGSTSAGSASGVAAEQIVEAMSVGVVRQAEIAVAAQAFEAVEHAAPHGHAPRQRGQNEMFQRPALQRARRRPGPAGRE